MEGCRQQTHNTIRFAAAVRGVCNQPTGTSCEDIQRASSLKNTIYTREHLKPTSAAVCIPTPTQKQYPNMNTQKKTPTHKTNKQQ